METDAKFVHNFIMAGALKKRLDSLLMRLVLMAAVPLIVAGGTGVFVFASYVRPLLEGELRADLVRANQTAARITNAWMEEQAGTLHFIADLPEISQWDTTEATAAARNIHAAFPQFRAVLLIKPDGYVLTDSAGVSGGYLGDRAYFRRALYGEANVANIISVRTNNTHMVIFATPVVGLSGEVVGVLAVPMQPETLYATLETGIQDARITSYILDAEGIRVAGERTRQTETHPPVNTAYSWSESSADVKTSGDSYWAAGTTLDETGWVLVSEMATSTVEDTYGPYNRALALVILGALSLTIVSAWVIAATIERPVAELYDFSLAVGSGTWNETREITNFRSTPLEIRQLQQALSTAASLVTGRNNELRRINDLLSATEQMAQLGSWEYDVISDTLQLSPIAYAILGIPAERKALSRRVFLAAIPAVDRQRIVSGFLRSIRTNETGFEIEHPVHQVSTGVIRFVHQRCLHTRDEAGKVVRTRGMILDITERHQLENSLREALSEKTALLQEVNHRVRNNLSVMSSLISLKEQLLPPGSPVKDVLVEMHGRIGSMAILHDQLYGQENLAQIDLEDYTGTLLDGIENSYGSPTIQLERRLQAITIDMHRVIPCGMIINELVTNAYKHAFPDHHGTISVSVSRLESTATEPISVEVRVHDDGTGPGQTERGDSAQGIGHTLVHQLAQQLHGTVVSSSGSPGTCITVRFPHDLAAI